MTTSDMTSSTITTGCQDDHQAGRRACPEYRTPEYYHCLTNAHFRSNVYEPEADTFLLMEALDHDAERLAELLLHSTRETPPRRRCCVELGCGSGTVLTHLAALVLKHAAAQGITANAPASASTEEASGFPLAIAVDVNPIALEATRQTWENTMRTFFPHMISTDEVAMAAGSGASPLVCAVSTPGTLLENTPTSVAPLQPVLLTARGDLFSALPQPSEGEALVCDVVLFNPPYVPTSMEELEATIRMEDIITAAWSGGPRGRVVLDRFLNQLPARLTRDGLCYVVLIKENDVEDVHAYIHAQFRQFHGIESGAPSLVTVEEVAARYTGEHLSIHRIAYVQ